MPKLHTFKYEIGYQYLHYEIVDTTSRLYDCGAIKYWYIVKCLKCGSLLERSEREIGEDIKCQECMRRMEYSRFSVGDVVNGLRILKKTPISAKNGHMVRAYLCECLIDGYQSVHAEHNLLQGKGCPVCAGIVIMRGINDIHTKAPWLGKLLANHEDGYQYGIGTKTKLHFKCPSCGEITPPLDIYHVYSYGHVPCRKCGDGISMPEKVLYNILQQLHIEFEYQKRFEWSDSRVYDFYIPNLNMLIETHGRQHYEDIPSSKWGALKDVRQNDFYKVQMALYNGITNYVVIDCSSLDSSVVVDSCKTSLSEYFDFENVDIQDIIAHAYTSFCIRTGDMWNSGIHDVNTIADKLGLNQTTIRRYLRTLTKNEYLNVSYPIKSNGGK